MEQSNNKAQERAKRTFVVNFDSQKRVPFISMRQLLSCCCCAATIIFLIIFTAPCKAVSDEDLAGQLLINSEVRFGYHRFWSGFVQHRVRDLIYSRIVSDDKNEQESFEFSKSSIRVLVRKFKTDKDEEKELRSLCTATMFRNLKHQYKPRRVLVASDVKYLREAFLEKNFGCLVAASGPPVKVNNEGFEELLELRKSLSIS